ncbi:hypothetical protein BLOT_004667 [Blomia tropicalis]|nr:hypothetical protein BLOT_004667 [Blomia tropicalis]
MHFTNFILRSLLMATFINIFIHQSSSATNNLEKVGPVLWGETNHHIKFNGPPLNALIVAYLTNPCFLPEKHLYSLNYCKSCYKDLIEEVITENCVEEVDQIQTINQINSTTKSRKSRGIVSEFAAFSTLILSFQTFMEVKRMQAEFKKTIEQIRSVESDIIQSQQMLVDSLRETNAKLETLDMTFKLVNKIMKTGIIMERLFQRAKNNQDFSKEFQHIYGNLEFCDKNYSCPMKVAQFKGCFYKKNQTEINMITMRIENNIINPNFKVFEAHPFALVHSDNISFCYYKYIGEKYIVYQMNTGCVWPLFNPTVINLADNQLAFDFQPTDGICLPMLNESVDSSYVIDKCKTKSNDSSFTAFQVWPKIVQEKDFVYIYCFNHSITYQGITEECGNAI